MKYFFTLSFMMLVSCGNKGELSYSSSRVNEQEQDKKQVVKSSKADVGVRRFDQLFYNLKAIFPFTEEDGFWNSLVNNYQDQKLNLPANNRVDSFSATTQIAYINLVSEFCFRAIINQAQAGRIWDVDIIRFNSTPNAQLSDESIDYFIDRSIEQFWPQKFRNDQELVDRAKEDLLLLSDELLVDENLNNRNTMRNWGLGMCVAIVANASSMIMP